MPSNHLILAIDIGGTKCDVLVSDAENGNILRRFRQNGHSLPPGICPNPKSMGIGRSPEMIRYCIIQALGDLSPVDIFLTGVISYPGIIDTIQKKGISISGRFPLSEGNSALLAENHERGIAIVSGTGVTGCAIPENGREFTIDADGPICGDWGGAYTIGRNFIRGVCREQNFSKNLCPETVELLNHFKNLQDFPQNTDTNLWSIVGYLLHKEDRSVVAALSKVCDECAENGSSLAQKILREAGHDLAESAFRAANFCGMAHIAGLPVIAAGSVLVNSDRVFNAMKEHIEVNLPLANLERAKHPQVIGQTIGAIKALNTPFDADRKIASLLKSFQ